jgi:soluble lytic murein transglycosylase-like protein
MARKFSGAARARGFSPIQVSDANISRMREENQRIERGMQARRDSIRQNDERQLQAMREDAAYYDKIRRRDFNIASQNVETERRQAEYDAAARLHDIRQQQANLLVSSIAQFSETAAKAQKAAKEKEATEAQQRGILFRKRYGGVDQAQINFDDGLRVEILGREQVEGTLRIADSEGAPAYEQSKTRVLTHNESAGFLKEDAKQKFQFKYEQYRGEFFQANPELMATPEEAHKALDQVTLDFLAEEGLDKYPPELLGDGLDLANKSDATFISGLVDRQVTKNNADITTAVTNAALSNWEEQGATSFRVVAGISGYPAAHKWVKEMATAMDENGNYILSDNEWMNVDVRGDGTSYYTGNPKEGFYARGIDILNAREEKRRQWNTNQNTTERQYQEKSKAWHRHIVVDGNDSPEDLAAAAESFEDDVKGLPEWLRKLRGAGDPSKGGYNAGLITTAKDLQARKMLYQGLVDKVFETDPKLGNELQKSLNEQDPFMRNDRYKTMHEIVGKLNTKKDAFGQYPASTTGSYNDSQRLQENFEQLVRRGVADGASIDDAATNAGRLIEQGHGDESSPFYRQYNPNTGFYEYPQLYTKTAREIADSLDQADTEFAKAVASGQIQDIFADPNMILTDVLFDQNVASMSRPGYAFPARVEMLAEKLKASPMEIMQRIADVKGKPAIKPPPSLQQVTEYPPAAKDLLNRFRSTNRDARGHGVGMATIGTGWNEAAVPENLREFYRASAQKHGISPAENSAMGEIESNHGMHRVSYNGTSFGVMQINKSAHPAFFAEFDGKNDDAANIDYGTQYYASLKQQYNNDPIVSAMAYNGGPGYYNMWAAGQTPDWVKTEADRAEWQRITTEMVNHGKKFAKALYKYSGDPAILQHPLILRN